MTRTKAKKEKAKMKAVEAKKAKNKARRGSRGAGSKAKHSARATDKFHRNVRGRRIRECKLRIPTGFGSKVGPAIGINPYATTAVCKGTYSMGTNEYYAEWSKPSVAVTYSSNVSNPEGLKDGGAGVIALRDIKDGERICPYVGRMQGKPCDDSINCQYDLHLGEKLYVCARELEYDVGYLLFPVSTEENTFKTVANMKVACPRNYGRYVNTLSVAQQDSGMQFNCIFEACDEGHDVVWLIADRDISEGSELLVDYGASFTLGGASLSYESSDEEGTVVDEEEDEWEEVE